MIDDDVLGKAYDGRLMRRLLTYLRPYRGQVIVAVVAIIGHSALDLAPPYLTKVVIDRYIPVGDLGGLGTIAALYLVALIASFLLEYLQTWTMQVIGQKIMFDLRMQLVSHLHRLDLRFYDRNPVGRLMTRITTDVDVLNELFTSGVVSVFGDVFTLIGIMARPHLDGLAPGACRVLGVAAHRRNHALVSSQCARVVPDGSHLDCPNQCVSPGAHHRHGDRAAVSARAA